MTTSGPKVALDEASHRALFPPPETRRDISRRALASALGREGLTALAVYAACVLVLVYGAVVVAYMWVSTDRDLQGALYWYAFAVAVGICGWFLSRQGTKAWLRTFVGVGVVIGAVLLITIGRNAHIRAAQREAEAEARGLLAAAGAAEVDARSSAESALLSMLCEQGGLDTSDGGSSGGRGARQDRCAITGGSADGQIAHFDAGDATASDDRYGAQLGCLPGWTVGTFVEWAGEASSDRQVAALSALASCEIGVVNPAAEAQAEDTSGTTATTATTGSTAATTTTEGAGPGGDAETASGGGADAASTLAGGQPTPEAQAAVRAALEVQRSELTAQEAVSAGADELLTFASGRTDFEQIRFSAAAWLVLVAAALLWYRRLEIRAGEHRLGPVDVQFEVAGDASGSEQGEGEARPPRTRAEAVFKESVIRNVPEPGAIPGGEALAPVGDLVAQSDVPHRTLISGVIEAARTILATRGGFTVIFSVRRSDDDKEHVAFVRLRDTRTGHHLASHVVYDKLEEQAARRAGYWIAGWIISRSDYVPSWAQWSEDDAASFPPLPLDWSAGVQPAARGPVAPGEFDPNTWNSLILAQRAYAYETTPPDAGGVDDGRRNHLAALEDIARAVHRTPRYPVAGYRRGAALSTMMFRGGDLASAAGLVPDAPAPAREERLPSSARLRYLLADLLLGDRQPRRPAADVGRGDVHVDEWVEKLLDRGEPFPDDMRREMLRLVAEWANRNRAALRWSGVARLRPSERFFWREFRRGGLERDWMLVSASELCLCAERLKFGLQLSRRPPEVHDRGAGEGRSYDDDMRRLVALEDGARTRALQADSHWQIAYNLACLYAIRADLWSQLAATARSDGEPARRAARRQAAARHAAACRKEAMDWLERCLDRPAAGQLVREWVDADGDLDALRGERQFVSWRRRIRSMADAPDARRDGRGGDDAAPPGSGVPAAGTSPGASATAG